MSPLLLGLLWAAVFAVPVSLLSRVRVRVRARTRPAPRPRGHASRLPAEPVSPRSWKGAARLLAVNVVLLFGLDTLTFSAAR